MLGKVKAVHRFSVTYLEDKKQINNNQGRKRPLRKASVKIQIASRLGLILVKLERTCTYRHTRYKHY